MVRNNMVLFMENPSLKEQIMDCQVFLTYARANKDETDVDRVVTLLASLKKKAGYP